MPRKDSMRGRNSECFTEGTTGQDGPSTPSPRPAPLRLLREAPALTKAATRRRLRATFAGALCRLPLGSAILDVLPTATWLGVLTNSRHLDEPHRATGMIPIPCLSGLPDTAWFVALALTPSREVGWLSDRGVKFPASITATPIGSGVDGQCTHSQKKSITEINKVHQRSAVRPYVDGSSAIFDTEPSGSHCRLRSKPQSYDCSDLC
jgi:hypothetical protein